MLTRLFETVVGGAADAVADFFEGPAVQALDKTFDALEGGVEYVRENPGKTVVAAAATVASVGAALVMAKQGKTMGKGSDLLVSGAIGYGKQKRSGGHDHRTSRGDDRTPAQKAADKAKCKPAE